MKHIVLFGDSHFGRCGMDRIRRLEKLIIGSVVYNCAAGGMSTRDGLARCEYVARLHPDYVVLSFGANDCFSNSMEIVPHGEFRKNLFSIAASFHGSCIIFFPCPPADDPNDKEGTEKFNRLIHKYNEIAQDVMASVGACCVPSGKVFGELTGRRIQYHETDGIHLNETGYDVLFKQLLQLTQ